MQSSSLSGLRRPLKMRRAWLGIRNPCTSFEGGRRARYRRFRPAGAKELVKTVFSPPAIPRYLSVGELEATITSCQPRKC